MQYHVNQQTGQIEDEDGRPVDAAPLNQVVGAPAGGGEPIPPASLASTAVPAAAVGPLAAPLAMRVNAGADEEGNPMPGPASWSPQANAVPKDQFPSTGGSAGVPVTEPIGSAAAAALPGKRVEGGTTSTTRTKIAPEEVAAHKRLQSSLDADVGLTKQEGEAKTAVSQAEADSARKQAEAEADHAARLAKVQTEWHGEMQKADAEVQKAVQERSAVKMEKFGANDPAWKTIGRALMIGLGELGAVLAKTGHNTALEIIRDQEKEHYDLERAKIEEADRKVTGAKENRAVSHEAKLDALADLERERYINNAALAAKAKELTAKATTAEQKVLGEKAAAEAEQRAAAAAQQYGALKRVQVESRQTWTNTVGGPAAGDGTGRAAGAMQLRAQMIEKGRDAMATADRLHKEGITLSEADREQLQNNEKEVATMEHSGATMAWLGRTSHLYARNKYQGLDQKKQELAQAYDVLSQIGSSVTSQSHEAGEIKHGRELFDLTSPGMGEIGRTQTYSRLRGILGAGGGLSGPYMGIAERGAAAAQAAPGVTTPSPGGGGPAMTAGDQMKLVNGRRAIVHANGTYDLVE